jgi:hypothetical protein
MCQVAGLDALPVFRAPQFIEGYDSSFADGIAAQFGFYQGLDGLWVVKCVDKTFT